MRPAEELLYDSEASFRLVDHAIRELSASGAELDREATGFLAHVMAQPGGFAELSRTLLRAYAETAGIVGRFRETAGMLDSSGIDRLQQMHGHLREVSSATELATHGILDGLTRAVSLVEQLDNGSAVSESERHKMMASLREELGGVVNQLQFQDITGQQLKHIETQLADMNRRINQVVKIFAPPAVTFANPEPMAPKLDKGEATAGSEHGQAVADEIFAIRGERKSA
ncbi:MAG: hypothetical protein ACREPM_19505 [Gemmatimonadaceae bacterium]